MSDNRPLPGDEHSFGVLPLSPEDRVILSDLKDKAWFKLGKTYGLLFLVLVYLYYRMGPGSTFRGSVNKMSHSDYNLVFLFFGLFFGIVFSYFRIRDFRRMVLPLQKELRFGKKHCTQFSARKYKDPIYDKNLLFYPGREDTYIALSTGDFYMIGDGEQLSIEVGCITGEVLKLKNEERSFKSAEEFSFSEV